MLADNHTQLFSRLWISLANFLSKFLNPRLTAHWLCENLKISLQMVHKALLFLKWASRTSSTLDLRKLNWMKLSLVGASRDNKNFSNSSFAETAIERNTWSNWCNFSTREMNLVVALFWFCIIFTGDSEEDDRTIEYLKGLLSCSLSIKWVRKTTQSFRNWYFDPSVIPFDRKIAFTTVPGFIMSKFSTSILMSLRTVFASVRTSFLMKMLLIYRIIPSSTSLKNGIIGLSVWNTTK